MTLLQYPLPLTTGHTGNKVLIVRPEAQKPIQLHIHSLSAAEYHHPLLSLLRLRQHGAEAILTSVSL